MKKFLIISILSIVVYLIGDYLYYNRGFYIPIQEKGVTTNVKSIGKRIYLKEKESYVPFEIKGVDLGSGIPGHFATDYAITEEDYKRWFSTIQEMGANTIKVSSILSDHFYEAFYTYNKDNPQPLYLVHGLWVNDYIQNSHRDGYDDLFLGKLLKDSKTLVDVIHGNKRFFLGEGIGSGFYKRDISPWVIGYILGVEWEPDTVAFTDYMNEDKEQYVGTYMYASEDATPFESMLAQVGDRVIEYETNKYGQQRLVAFSNWPITDPFEYDPFIEQQFNKFAKIDIENIQLTKDFLAGTFVAYDVYPYYPDYLSYDEKIEQYKDGTGKINTYQHYLKKLNDYHTMPLIISKFGIPSARGMAQKDKHGYRNQGGMSEIDQAQALAQSYEDIQVAGSAGSFVFSWQDEWFKRSWNTMHGVDLLKTPYWNDYQTNEQHFGLLAFDPGKEKSISYVDGAISEWYAKDVVVDKEDLKLSVKYDEKFIYLLLYKKDFKETEKLYVPIDLTPKSGSVYYKNKSINFDREVDFVIEIDGRQNSRIVVQERYEVLRALFYQDTHKKDAYEYEVAVDTPVFKPINLMLPTFKNRKEIYTGIEHDVAEVYETGKLNYGNANPESKDYNSLADFYINGDYIELKLPWQILNFSNPSEMMIHDDYYVHYGVEEIKVNEMYIGLGSHETRNIALEPFKLEGWEDKPTYHERLKPAYYAMQKIWKD